MADLDLHLLISLQTMSGSTRSNVSTRTESQSQKCLLLAGYRHIRPVMQKDLLVVTSGIFVKHDEGCVAITKHAIAGPVLTAQHDHLGINNDTLVVHAGLNSD